jgi:hypothetical protein
MEYIVTPYLLRSQDIERLADLKRTITIKCASSCQADRLENTVTTNHSPMNSRKWKTRS